MSTPSHLPRRAWPALLACLVLSAGGLRAEPGPRPELERLPEPVRRALRSGQVVLLETVLDDAPGGVVVGTKFIAVIEGSPPTVVEELRQYEELPRVVRGLREVTVDRHPSGDRLDMRFSPHPLLPTISLSKQVVFEVDDAGDATVGVELLDTTCHRLEDQRWDWRLLRLGESATLAIFETRDTYHRLPFKRRVLTRTADTCERVITDLRDRCASRAEALAVARLGAAGQGSPSGPPAGF